MNSCCKEMDPFVIC